MKNAFGVEDVSKSLAGLGVKGKSISALDDAGRAQLRSKISWQKSRRRNVSRVRGPIENRGFRAADGPTNKIASKYKNTASENIGNNVRAAKGQFSADEIKTIKQGMPKVRKDRPVTVHRASDSGFVSHKNALAVNLGSNNRHIVIGRDKQISAGTMAHEAAHVSTKAKYGRFQTTGANPAKVTREEARADRAGRKIDLGYKS